MKQRTCVLLLAVYIAGGSWALAEPAAQENQSLVVSPGHPVQRGTLTMSAQKPLMPPGQLAGEKYSAPSLIVEEEGDQLQVFLSEKYSTLQYHNYLLRFVRREGDRLTVKITSSPRGTPVSEAQAVTIALQVAHQRGQPPMPRAVRRTLEKGAWIIEIFSSTITDACCVVELDATTGDIIRIHQVCGA